MHGRISHQRTTTAPSATSDRSAQVARGHWSGRNLASVRDKRPWVSALAGAHVLACGALLFSFDEGPGTVPFSTTSVIVLGGLSLWFGLSGHYPHMAPLAIRSERRRLYWRSCVVCLVGSYAVTLFTSHPASAPYVFSVLLALSHAAVWSRLGRPTESWERLTCVLHGPKIRATGAALYLCVVLLTAGEMGLRGYAFINGDLAAVQYVTDVLKLPPGAERLGRLVNSEGYWDEEFHRNLSRSGLRIAALGDEITLCGNARTNFLSRVERQMQGVEVFHFGVAQASPREYAAQMQSEVAAVRPNIALVFLSVASDITEAPPLPGPFEWQGLHLIQRAARFSGASGRIISAANGVPLPGYKSRGIDGTDDPSKRLRVCRVPMRDSLETRWREVFAHLDEVVQRCREQQIEPALVVVPSEFQVDEVLRRILCRHAGYRRDQIDIDLPQRRLAAYAKDRPICMLDLLPHLKASKKPIYQTNTDHFSQHGHALVAEILCEWLKDQDDNLLLAYSG